MNPHFVGALWRSCKNYSGRGKNWEKVINNDLFKVYLEEKFGIVNFFLGNLIRVKNSFDSGRISGQIGQGRHKIAVS